MKKPVAVPANDDETAGTIRRRPDVVADSSKTAWKYRGMLKRIAFVTTPPMLFEMIRLDRGFFSSKSKGMMGSSTYDSTHMKRGHVMLKVTSDTMTKGWDQGYTLPPRFYRIMLVDCLGDVINYSGIYEHFK